MFALVIIFNSFFNNILEHNERQSLTYDDDGRRHECPDEEAEDEEADDDAQALDQVDVGDLHGLGRADAEDHRDPVDICIVLIVSRIKHFFTLEYRFYGQRIT